MTEHEPDTASRGRGEPRKAALAGWVGSALEYYDFFIYGTAAALVFNRIFFPESDPTTGTLLALASFGVGYLARPLGAILLGHVGDRLGRKKVLVTTLLLMGGTTFLVGCLPTYEEAGLLAPAALVVLRLIQGLSAAGEQAGANSMTLEHSPQHRRAFFTSFTLSGTQGGQILATAVFLPVAALPDEQMLAWGWRVPFWLSAVVVLVGFVIRRRLDETPAFEQESAAREVARFPLVELFRDHWPALLRVLVASLVCSVSTVFTVFALSFAVNTVGLERTSMLWVGVLANVVALAAIPLCARLSDRIGRKPVFVAGALGSAVLTAAYLWSISTGSYALIFTAGIALFGVVYSASNGVWPAFYGEMFDTRVRLTGMALGTQVGFAVSGFAPSVAEALAGGSTSGWIGVSLFVAVLCACSAIAALTARETSHLPLERLGAASGAEPARART